MLRSQPSPSPSLGGGGWGAAVLPPQPPGGEGTLRSPRRASHAGVGPFPTEQRALRPGPSVPPLPPSRGVRAGAGEEEEET